MSDNHHLEFAKRHSNPIASTFDAYSAIWRLQALLEDVDNLGALVNAQPPDGVHLPFYGLEVASYYTVGFVTCLEWHAKSRLNDLFSYKPASVRSDDLKGLVGDKVVSQMTATGVTVPQLLAAATKIGNSHSYLKVFERLFEALGVELKLYEILAKDIFEELSAAGDGSRSRVDRFKELFEYRNNLVHEIDISVIGSYTFRGNLTIESARDLGVKALNIISEIERQLTLHAPNDFPNLLDNTFFPRDELKDLDEEIVKLENYITDRFSKIRTHDDNRNLGGALWESALAAGKEGFQKELEFVQNAGFLHNRYVNFRKPILLRMKRSRLHYLRAIVIELSPSKESLAPTFFEVASNEKSDN